MKRTLNSINVMIALVLSSALFYLGVSNYKLSDANKDLSNNINNLMKLMKLDYEEDL